MERVLAGIRPTGKLHWGNYFGALQNWVKLQDQYECFFFIADWHSLTSEYANPSPIKKWTIEVLKDILAAGVDPKKCTLFIQSHVPEHAELHLLLSMYAPIGWLERVPTYKEMKQELADKDLSNYGFLGYPVLQSADILLYQASKVPVGEDQVSHLELTRELIRRFHHLTGREVFVEPQPLLTKTPRVPGMDRRKMSKSFNNAVWLDDPPEEINAKAMQTLTDPARTHRSIPGNPDVCTVYDYHKLVSDPKTLKWSNDGCRSAGIGCVECKQAMAKNAVAYFKEFRERKAKLKNETQLFKIIAEGANRAQKVAAETLGKVKEALGLNYASRSL
ncbi:MAG: tryptophan--tRNA ligase [Deltaproteobacteria bacterium]|nr:tryptophan--tRNA ligase [Deltaproteobacteria bacterium]